MDIRITHRVEGEAKPASGFAGALGGTRPASAVETTVEVTDVPIGYSGSVIAQAAQAFATALQDGLGEGAEAPKTYDGEEL